MQITSRLREGESIGDRIMKVNHAGEHGAVNIYRGQLLVCRVLWPHMVEELAEFKEHEERHRALFAAELNRRGKRRCRSYLLCGVGGFVLGVVSGLFGPSSVAATTVAVEQVVLEHLEAQLRELAGRDRAGHDAVAAIVAEEKSHRDRASLLERQGSVWPVVFRPVVASSTEAVIWLGMRL
jgi:3-demethoxyubiquinol 3-hydroxylase